MKENLRIVCLIIFLTAFFIQIGQSQYFAYNSDMGESGSSNRIAIAAVDDSITSEISSRAGKAPYYFIFDNNGVFLKSQNNPALNKKGGSSSIIAELFVRESVKTVIAGNFGVKMKKILERNKIEYHEYSGFVKRILEEFIKNT